MIVEQSIVTALVNVYESDHIRQRDRVTVWTRLGEMSQVCYPHTGPLGKPFPAQQSIATVTWCGIVLEPERRVVGRPGRTSDDVPRLRLLHAAVFFSSFDRLVIAPLLLAVAVDLDVPLHDVTVMATVYLAGYGTMQIVWGMVSDRLGRVRTLRIALVIAAVAGVATSLSPTLELLTLSRLVAGGAYAAIVPGALIYVGDTVPIARRHGPLTDVMMATALGMSAATLLGAFVADLVSWRLAFGLPSAVVLGLAYLMRSVPEPQVRPERESVMARLATVARNRWALLVLTFAFLEGMVLLGVLNYLPTSLQFEGMSTAGSGLVTAAYGIGIVVFSRVVKVLSTSLPATRLIAVGGVLGTFAYVALVVDQALVGVLLGSILLAGAWAFMHSTMQKWVTEVAPRARATSVSLFASSLFLGSAASTAFGAGYADREDFMTYFVIGTTVMAGLAITATVMHARYPGR